MPRTLPLKSCCCSLLSSSFITLNTVEKGVRFPLRTDGMVICGAPVGSDFYIDAFVRWKTSAAISKLHAISLLSISDFIHSKTCGFQISFQWYQAFVLRCHSGRPSVYDASFQEV